MLIKVRLFQGNWWCSSRMNVICCGGISVVMFGRQLSGGSFPRELGVEFFHPQSLIPKRALVILNKESPSQLSTSDKDRHILARSTIPLKNFKSNHMLKETRTLQLRFSNIYLLSIRKVVLP